MVNISVELRDALDVEVAGFQLLLFINIFSEVGAAVAQWHCSY